MEIQQINITEIKEYEKNAKKHDEQQIKNVMQSIKEFGMVQPIVIDENNTIIIGHCRYRALQRLKWEEVPVVKIENLSDQEVNKLRLLDNKLNESDWDLDLLLEQVGEIDWSDFDINWNLEDDFEEDDYEEIEPEIEFTKVLNEESNYIVLKFTNSVDWLQACSVFDIKQVQALSTRKDGTVPKNSEKIGVGRVLNGVDVIRKILGDEKNEN